MDEFQEIFEFVINLINKRKSIKYNCNTPCITCIGINDCTIDDRDPNSECPYYASHGIIVQYDDGTKGILK